MSVWFSRLPGLSTDGQSFTAPQAELAAAAAGRIAAPLCHLGCIEAAGEDAAHFLHNQLTNDIEHLANGEARRAAWCTSKGRMLADLVVLRREDRYLLILSKDILPAVLKRFSMFVLRSKVALRDASADWALIGLSGTGFESVLTEEFGEMPPMQTMASCQGPGGILVVVAANRYLLACPASRAEAVWQALTSIAQPAGTAAWDWLDVRDALPRITVATQEAFVPQMVHFDQIGGVSFNKGCYPGQEIVARARYLGKIKRHLYRSHLDEGTPKAGQELFTGKPGEPSCGRIVLAAHSPEGGWDLLLSAHEAAAEGDDVHLCATDGPRLTLTCV